VQAEDAVVVQILADILGQVPGRLPCFAQGSLSDRDVTEQLDVDEAPPPRRLDLAVADVAADGEVDVQAVAAGVSFGYPKIGKGFTEEFPQVPEELGDIVPEQFLVVAGHGVGERPETVEPVGRCVAPDCRTGSPRGLLRRSFGVPRLTPASPVHRLPLKCALECAPGFGCSDVETEHPAALFQRPEFRCYIKSCQDEAAIRPAAGRLTRTNCRQRRGSPRSRQGCASPPAAPWTAASALRIGGSTLASEIPVLRFG